GDRLDPTADLAELHVPLPEKLKGTVRRLDLAGQQGFIRIETICDVQEVSSRVLTRIIHAIDCWVKLDISPTRKRGNTSAGVTCRTDSQAKIPASLAYASGGCE